MNTHLINGEWTGGAAAPYFQAHAPAQNAPLPRKFAEGGAAEVNAAAQAAQAAFAGYAALSDEARAAFLRAIAAQIEARAAEIIKAAADETALPEARLQGELGRTAGQLRMFAGFIESGAHLDKRFDAALPERAPLPRPDLRLMQRPLGVVAVFGASNFPLAFSVAGGDTAAALAAGCPVIVKGHPAHPHTGEIVAGAVEAARAQCDIAPGVFAFIQGSAPELSRALVEHPAVAAVGFTGSFRAGRALFDVACRRETPIPFYAEMGSINPVFALKGAAADNANIAAGWAQSLTLGGGQFCTNPGVLFYPAAGADAFLQAAAAALADKTTHIMLTPGIAASYRAAAAAAEQAAGGCHWRGAADDGGGCAVAAMLFCCGARAWLEAPALREEIFGPAGVVVTYESMEELQQAAASLRGQLTATLWLSDGDDAQARELLPLLEQKAGRVLCNGFPTGVEVADAMMHGGPYPAATYAATSVGSLAIRRFLRPVCHQNFPAALLPSALR